MFGLEVSVVDVFGAKTDIGRLVSTGSCSSLRGMRMALGFSW